ADGLAQFKASFANARGENQRVGTVELEKIRTDPVARTEDESVQRKLRLGVSLSGGLLDVAHVVRNSTQTLESGFFAKLPFHFFQRQAQRSHNERHGERVEVAHAIIVRQAGLRAHAETVADSHAVEDATDRGTAAEVTGNHAQLRFADGRVAPIAAK